MFKLEQQHFGCWYSVGLIFNEWYFKWFRYSIKKIKSIYNVKVQPNEPEPPLLCGKAGSIQKLKLKGWSIGTT